MLSTALLLTCQLVLFAMNIIEQDETDFQDLGKLMLGGLAVGVGIAFTVIKLRLRDKKPPAAEFIFDQGVSKKEIDVPSVSRDRRANLGLGLEFISRACAELSSHFVSSRTCHPLRSWNHGHVSLSSR